ncbi:hypothetical protein CBS147346_6139 [Aspergillus niger]|nr:hypothetical protein CBS147346_6139 [Aspergillus niger]
MDELHDPTCSTLKPRVSVDHRDKYRLIHTPLRCQKPLIHGWFPQTLPSVYRASIRHQSRDSIHHNCLTAMKCNLLHSHL